MSPNQLIPTQPYTLSYFITDHTDTNTYYVRAVVYDAITGEVLDTQNLTQQSTNSRLFSKVTQAPGDPSGHGRRILVVATAYEDSGYTTKSSLYQEQAENYIVIKAGAGLTLGGGGFGGIDYNIIKDIFVAEFDKYSENWKKVITLLNKIYDLVDSIPKTQREEDFEPILSSLEGIKSQIGKIPTDNKVDLKPILGEISRTIKAIEDNKIEPTDLTPINDLITELKDSIDESNNEKINILAPFIDGLKENLPKLLDSNIKEAILNQKFTFKPVETELEKPKKVDEVVKPRVDFNKIMGI